MKPYRYIALGETEEQAVTSGYKEGEKHHYRERCYGVLLSHRGHTIPAIALLLGKRRETIHQWFNRWDTSGIEGLGIKAGRGLKAALDSAGVELVAEIKKK